MKKHKLVLCLLLLAACATTSTVPEETPSNLVTTFEGYDYANVSPEIWDLGKAITIHSVDELAYLASNYDSYQIYDPYESNQPISELKDWGYYKVVYRGKENEVAIWVYYPIVPEESMGTLFTLYPYDVGYGATYNYASLERIEDGVITLEGIKLSVKIEEIVDHKKKIEGNYYCNSLYVNLEGKPEPLAFILGDITWTTFRADYGPPYFHAGKYKQISDEVYQFIHYPLDEKDYFVIRDGVLYYPIDKSLSVDEIENTTFTNGCTYNTGWIEPTEEIRYISIDEVDGKRR